MATQRIHEIEFSELMQLEPHGPDTYVGIAARYPWGGRLFGGQVVAQALRAASLTVPADRPAHSLHSYFIRAGSNEEPIRYEVERLRDGRSFTTRQVVARQSGGAILNLSVSFQVVEDEVDAQIAVLPPGLPWFDDPSLPDHSWAGLLERKATFLDDGTMGYWIRLNAEMGDDPADHQCALAFMSDAAPSRAPPQPQTHKAGEVGDPPQLQGASHEKYGGFQRPTETSHWDMLDNPDQRQ
jgi:acyl-CoA thioesterase-2